MKSPSNSVECVYYGYWVSTQSLRILSEVTEIVLLFVDNHDNPDNVGCNVLNGNRRVFERGFRLT